MVGCFGGALNRTIFLLAVAMNRRRGFVPPDGGLAVALFALGAHLGPDTLMSRLVGVEEGLGLGGGEVLLRVLEGGVDEHARGERGLGRPAPRQTVRVPLLYGCPLPMGALIAGGLQVVGDEDPGSQGARGSRARGLRGVLGRRMRVDDSVDKVGHVIFGRHLGRGDRVARELRGPEAVDVEVRGPGAVLADVADFDVRHLRDALLYERKGGVERLARSLALLKKRRWLSGRRVQWLIVSWIRETMKGLRGRR